jgi:uncharacterized repeat protein (TIGR03803 family)
VALALASASLARGQVVYQRLRSFGFAELSAILPAAKLIEGSDGMLYGVTQAGGEGGNGAVFRLNRDGTGFAVLRSFMGTNGDGASPLGAPCWGTNGMLYGTTANGGVSNL